MAKTFTDIIFDAVLKRHNDDEIFWTNIFEKKIHLYEKGGGTDWDKPNSKTYYQILLNDVRKLVGIPRTSAELGCGTGILSLLMAAEGSNVVLVDHLPEAIKYAQICEQRMKKDIIFKGKVRYELADINNFNPKWGADLVHNCGVIEEMEKDEATSVIGAMKKAARSLVMVGVPNFYNPYLLQKFLTNGKGTERYFSRGSLGSLMMRAGLNNVETITTSCVHPKLPKGFNRSTPFGFLHLAIGRV